MKVILTGATGMVGSEVLRQAIADPEISEVTTITRGVPGISHPKLSAIVHKDFLNYTGLEDVFRSHDACIWCLGISQTLVSREEYEIITYDYAIAGATAMLKANPSIAFIFLSGAGADPTEKAGLFSRVKGKTENALLKMPFKKFYIARPAGIKPAHVKSTAPWYEKVFAGLYPVLKVLLPAYVITSQELAIALLHLVKKGNSKTIVSSGELKRISS